jgi:hypothetical protein
MTGPNANFNDVIVTTLKKRQKKFADNVSNHKGQINLLDGGETIVRELEYAENSTYKRYSGYDPLDMTPSEVFTAAEYDWVQSAVAVLASGLELRKNKGETRTINLMQARMKNAQKTMMNMVSVDVYSAGTLVNQMGGCQHLIQDDPTASSVVGGINQSTEEWWQNQLETHADSADSTKINGYMKALWLKCVRGSDHPSLIVADAILYSAYETSLTAIQRITTPTTGASGYTGLEFYGVGGKAPVIFDDACPTQRMYFVNDDYFHFDVHEDANFEPLAKRDAWNQDAIGVPIIFMGNLTCSNRALQGVLIDT